MGLLAHVCSENVGSMRAVLAATVALLKMLQNTPGLAEAVQGEIENMRAHITAESTNQVADGQFDATAELLRLAIGLPASVIPPTKH